MTTIDNRSKLASWGEAFAPLLERHVQQEGSLQNRGAERYYVTLPFDLTFTDSAVFEDEDILAVVKVSDPGRARLAPWHTE
ncbi:MAG: hypothetical protein H7Z38_05655 [Rubrivivax sp.]|nr:hypothetical protein [Pyrinomonadaceae bacterium]